MKREKIHGRVPIITNAHHNREQAMRMFEAGLSATDIAREFPAVFYTSPCEDTGKPLLGQRYGFYFAEAPDILETKYMIHATLVTQFIEREGEER